MTRERWKTLVVLQIVTLLAVVLASAAQLATTLGNRNVGQGNRVVTCTILERVDPGTQIAECAATAVKR